MYIIQGAASHSFPTSSVTLLGRRLSRPGKRCAESSNVSIICCFSLCIILAFYFTQCHYGLPSLYHPDN